MAPASRRRWVSNSNRRWSPSRLPALAGRRRSCAPSATPTNISFRSATCSRRRIISPLESSMPKGIAPKLLAEFVGTFSFVFIGAGAAAVVGSGLGLSGIVAVAFAHGLTIMAFAFAYGSVSGGHMNPAVTVGVLAAGAMGAGEAIGYIISQLMGGVGGALLLQTVLGGSATGLGTPALAHNLGLGAISLTITPAGGFMIEAVLAFFLVT